MFYNLSNEELYNRKKKLLIENNNGFNFFFKQHRKPVLISTQSKLIKVWINLLFFIYFSLNF